MPASSSGCCVSTCGYHAAAQLFEDFDHVQCSMPQRPTPPFAFLGAADRGGIFSSLPSSLASPPEDWVTADASAPTEAEHSAAEAIANQSFGQGAHLWLTSTRSYCACSERLCGAWSGRSHKPQGNEMVSYHIILQMDRQQGEEDACDRTSALTNKQNNLFC